MIKFNPELAKSAPSEVLPSTPASQPGRPATIYSEHAAPPPYEPPNSLGSLNRHSLAVPSSLEGVSDAINDDDEVQVGQNFTYIPPNPKRYYKRLLEICIQSDLDAMDSLPPDQEVSLGILSVPHVELINECALRWRITHSYRATCFLDVMRSKYEREDVPLDCIPEALQLVQKTINDLELGKWTRQDVSSTQVLCIGSLFKLILVSSTTISQQFSDYFMIYLLARYIMLWMLYLALNPHISPYTYPLLTTYKRRGCYLVLASILSSLCRKSLNVHRPFLRFSTVIANMSSSNRLVLIGRCPYCI